MNEMLKVFLERLEKFKKRIQDISSKDQASFGEFQRLVLGDFFETIRSFAPARELYEERLFYMRNLVNDKRVQKIQSELFDLIKSMGRLLLKERYVEKYLDDGRNYKPNSSQFSANRLEEEFNQSKDAFNVSRFSLLLETRKWEIDEKISLLVPVVHIRRQYVNFEEEFHRLEYSFNEIENKAKQSELASLWNKYSELMNHFLLMVEEKPRNLHLMPFENLALLHAGYTLDSYFPEERDNSLLRLDWDLGGILTDTIKQDVKTVYDDLEFFLNISSPHESSEKPENQVNSQTEKIHKNRDTALVLYDRLTWRFYYKNKKLHSLTKGKTIWHFFDFAFTDAPLKYELDLDVLVQRGVKTKRVAVSIRNFRRVVSQKLKKHSAPSSLFGDTFLEREGNKITISTVFGKK